MEFTRKDSTGKEYNVRITFKHPYDLENKNHRNIYCIIYSNIQYKEKKHWWSKKMVTVNSEFIMHHEATGSDNVIGYSKEDFEGWADLALNKMHKETERYVGLRNLKNMIGE